MVTGNDSRDLAHAASKPSPQPPSTPPSPPETSPLPSPPLSSSPPPPPHPPSPPPSPPATTPAVKKAVHVLEPDLDNDDHWKPTFHGQGKLMGGVELGGESAVDYSPAPKASARKEGPARLKREPSTYVTEGSHHILADSDSDEDAQLDPGVAQSGEGSSTLAPGSKLFGRYHLKRALVIAALLACSQIALLSSVARAAVSWALPPPPPPPPTLFESIAGRVHRPLVQAVLAGSLGLLMYTLWTVRSAANDVAHGPNVMTLRDGKTFLARRASVRRSPSPPSRR